LRLDARAKGSGGLVPVDLCQVGEHFGAGPDGALLHQNPRSNSVSMPRIVERQRFEQDGRTFLLQEFWQPFNPTSYNDLIRAVRKKTNLKFVRRVTACICGVVGCICGVVG